MYALARRMADAGRRVVCTTTTKIFPPENGLPVVLLEGVADPVAAVHDALFAAPCVVAVSYTHLVRQGMVPGKVFFEQRVPCGKVRLLLLPFFREGFAGEAEVRQGGGPFQPFKFPG